MANTKVSVKVLSGTLAIITMLSAAVLTPKKVSALSKDCLAESAVNVARNQIGYTAGSGKWTKYANDFDTKWPNFYNYPKQGADWCDIFVDWCFVTAFGEANARELLRQPTKSCGAGCYYSLHYFMDYGQYFSRGTKLPLAGDQVFFGTSTNYESGVTHTGLVESVNYNNSTVTVIEGNTSNSVQRKTYSFNYNRILGYGRPRFTISTGALDFVTNLYQQALGRTPSADERNYWAAKITKGTMGSARVAYEFFTSAEFLNRNTSNEAFVNMLYKGVLTRNPDSSGFNYWVGRLRGGSSRVSIIQEIANSAEFRNDVCKYKYDIFAG
ncbi:MAG: DUF4214 domain-containing protein [Clostridiales bacterium]|nr:DUF4214 domain-containing protein [Clostridiales bacterium]